MSDAFQTRIIAAMPRPGDAGQRLAAYLAARFTYRDAAAWQLCLERGELTLNGQVADGGEVLQPGDRIEWRPGDLTEPEVELSFTELFADQHLLAVNKPGNLPTHPGGPFFRHTLWHLLCRRYGEIFPVNRLDRETSGVILAARDAETAARLSRELPRMQKRYLAWVFGDLAAAREADGRLLPDPGSPVRKKQRFIADSDAAASPGGITAHTTLLPRVRQSERTLVEARPHTGRMHQIRATLFSLGYPLVGDKLYGPDDRCFLKIRTDALTAADYAMLGMRRQALHAWRLRLPHPYEPQRTLEFEAPYPVDFPPLSQSQRDSFWSDK